MKFNGTSEPDSLLRDMTESVRNRSSETSAAGIPWSQFAGHRAIYRRRWPTIWHLPARRSLFAMAKRRGVPAASVLDVGATHRVWENEVRRNWPRADYRSLDLDRSNPHDYYAFEEVDRQFDLVLCFEVLEHLEPADAVSLVQQCRDVCRPGGHLLFSVPNVLTPGVQLEFTHKTAFLYYDLPGLLAWSGLEIVDGCRVTLSGLRTVLLHKYFVHALHRLLRVDYCQMISMLARRPADADD